jgi:hypothetical protein
MENRVCGPAFCIFSMWQRHTPRSAFLPLTLAPLGVGSWLSGPGRVAIRAKRAPFPSPASAAIPRRHPVRAPRSFGDSAEIVGEDWRGRTKCVAEIVQNVDIERKNLSQRLNPSPALATERPEARKHGGARPPLPVGISPARGEIDVSRLSPLSAPSQNRGKAAVCDLPPCGGDADRQRGARAAMLAAQR